MQQQYETFGNYILLEKIASGGMAEVYLAKKIAASGVQKFVAIKRILSQFSESEDFIQMFKDEAKIAINLNHSNVVSIYDFGVQSHQFYIVMEFVEGKNLRQILNRMKKEGKYFSPGQVVHMVKQIASGLDHAHRCIDPTTGQPLNIIHRDMSPQNVMLSFEGESKIVDFGIAKAETQLESTRAGTLKGKFGYMSPEQVEGQVIDSRTDIFALGIMIWEMLANQRLFLANSEINTLRKIRECNVPSLRKINPNLPTELDQIVLRALKKDKSQRYQTSAELSRDLASFLSRYEPDFSVLDFSSFIKSLFSEEIIEIRKRQIIYSQVTVASHHDVFSEKTEIVTETHSEIIEGLSFDEMSLNTITKKSSGRDHTNSGIVRREQVSGMDFSRAVPEDPEAAKLRRLKELKQVAKQKAHKVKANTFTNPNFKVSDLNRSLSDATMLTIIFALSFTLALFAYVNRFHPNLAKSICANALIPIICDRFAIVTSSNENTFRIQTDPLGAAVYINGKKVGHTPYEPKQDELRLPATLGFRKDGYRSHLETLRELPQKNIEVALEKVPVGYLIINSIGSEVFVNGLRASQGEKVAVPAGEQVTVKIVNPVSQLSKTETFVLEEGQVIDKVIVPPAAN